MIKRNLFIAAIVVLLTSLAAQPLSAQTTTGSGAAKNQTGFDAKSFDRTFAHRTAMVNNVKIHYVTGGKGEALVLLHGWPETWRAWRKTMPAFAERYTVIVPDLPGLGDSSAPTAYDTETIAGIVHELVQQLGYKRIRLVGHDVGMWVAYSYAARYPAEVTQLVMLDAVLPGIATGAGLPLPPDTNKKTFQLAFNAVPDLPEELVKGRERVFLTWFFRNKAQTPQSIQQAEINEYIRAYSAPGKMNAGFAYYRAVYGSGEQNKELAKTKLPMPVLALGGETATGMGVLKAMQTVAENVRGGVVPNCGHFVQEEQPAYLVAQVLEFFNS